MPAICISFGRSRAITSSLLMPRSASGLSATVSWPRLMLDQPEVMPMVLPTLCDGRVGEQDVDDALLPLRHRVEADVGAGLGAAHEQAGVLDRQEALRHDAVELDRADDDRRASPAASAGASAAPSRGVRR